MQDHQGETARNGNKKGHTQVNNNIKDKIQNVKVVEKFTDNKLNGDNNTKKMNIENDNNNLNQGDDVNDVNKHIWDYGTIPIKKGVHKCDGCRERGNPAIYKASYKNSGKYYCKLHIAYYQIMNTYDNTKYKKCRNYWEKRWCSNLIDINSDQTLCQRCYESYRTREDNRLEQRDDNRNIEGKCWVCKVDYDDPNEFIVVRGDREFSTKKCRKCRKKIAEKEVEQILNGKKIRYSLSIEALNRKKEWIANNRDKMYKYFVKYRGRKMQCLGDKYWEHCAEIAKKYRAMKTDEERFEYNERHRMSLTCKLSYYKTRAKKYGIEWGISDDIAIEMFTKNCFYCGISPDKYHNGIDRVDNDKGYVINNIVPCCTICNIIKGALDIDVFYKRVIHILTHVGKIDGCKFSDIFPKSESASYDSYKRRADMKGLDFDLTLNDFFNLIKKDCYLCGIKSDNSHRNGIDRKDSSLGYKHDNCYPCCSECNYMKNNYSYELFIEKLYMIYIFQHDNIINNQKHVLSYFEPSIDVDKDIFGDYIDDYIDDYSDDLVEIFRGNNILSINNPLLYLYRKCESKNNYSKTPIRMTNINTGQWICKELMMKKGIPNDKFLKMQSLSFKNRNDIDKTKINTIVFDFWIDEHKLSSFALGQTTVNEIDIGTQITNDKKYMIVGNVFVLKPPSENPYVSLNVTYYYNKVVEIVFGVDSSRTTTCKCDICNSHRVRFGIACKCSTCNRHSVHGTEFGELCYWCSEEGYPEENYNYREDAPIKYKKNKQNMNYFIEKERKDPSINFPSNIPTAKNNMTKNNDKSTPVSIPKFLPNPSRKLQEKQNGTANIPGEKQNKQNGNSNHIDNTKHNINALDNLMSTSLFDNGPTKFTQPRTRGMHVKERRLNTFSKTEYKQNQMIVKKEKRDIMTKNYNDDKWIDERANKRSHNQ